jgi:hypothetical protein
MDSDLFIFGSDRTLCDVLQEMRKCHQTYNFGYLPGLIEEAQSMGNRMEAGLGTKQEVEHLIRILRKLKKERKQLMKEVADLNLILEKEEDD